VGALAAVCACLAFVDEVVGHLRRYHSVAPFDFNHFGSIEYQQKTDVDLSPGPRRTISSMTQRGVALELPISQASSAYHARRSGSLRCCRRMVVVAWAGTCSRRGSSASAQLQGCAPPAMDGLKHRLGHVAVLPLAGSKGNASSCGPHWPADALALDLSAAREMSSCRWGYLFALVESRGLSHAIPAG
jgi:hypothetical protein